MALREKASLARKGYEEAVRIAVKSEVKMAIGTDNKCSLPNRLSHRDVFI
jgi:imidazolonepropionase-like amidohydrolase